jgi:hypothetical protein
MVSEERSRIGKKKKKNVAQNQNKVFIEADSY